MHHVREENTEGTFELKSLLAKESVTCYNLSAAIRGKEVSKGKECQVASAKLSHHLQLKKDQIPANSKQGSNSVTKNYNTVLDFRIHFAHFSLTSKK